jgi:hypothetical protein
MNKEVGKKIGLSMGAVEGLDVGEEGVGWGCYLRIRVVLELGRPLARGIFLYLSGKDIWVHFKYKKLSKFCFSCGSITHGGGGCPSMSSKRLHGGVEL